MRVVGINGSPRKDGNTFLALEEMSNQLKKEGIQVEIVHVGADSIRGCIGCGYCTTSEENLCVFKDDIVNETIQKLREADGIIFWLPYLLCRDRRYDEIFFRSRFFYQFGSSEI